ncbi:MAG TPA: right-handed parallel beta-helix repeat-containing protein, partial [Myxococcota bacterium]|nr:right-handed parallel beta-helix repeat-containing protein [Myxococcota bacterium]
DGAAVDLLFNSADQGGAVYVDSSSSLVLEQSKLLANQATDGGGVNSLGSVSLTNVIVGFNSATGDGGGLLLVNAAATLTNTVLAGNTGTGLYLSGTSSTGTVRNSIIYDNSAYGVLVDSGSSYSGTYTDVYGNTTANYSGTANVTGVNGNISSDPKFTAYTDDGDMSNDNFGLQTSSPGVNTGNPTASYNDADGTRNNMGAYGGPGSNW